LQIHISSRLWLLSLFILLCNSTSVHATFTEESDIAPCYSTVSVTTGSALTSVLPEITPRLSPRAVNERFRHELLEYTTEQLSKQVNMGDGLIYDGDIADLRSSAVGAILWAEIGNFDLAERAINSVISEQVTDIENASFGNFPVNPGGQDLRMDNNWSAFIGTSLVLFYDRYSNQYSDEFVTTLRTSIRNAAIHTSCLNMFIESTNIILLRTFFLLRSGEILRDDQLAASGRNLWDLVVSHTLNSGISEYNSTNYARWNLWNLSFIKEYVADERIASEAARMQLLFWWSITNHYHSPTSQLAGATSRTFTDRMIYEPTHLQPILYSESYGEIPLLYQQEQQGEEAINLVYPIILNASWPTTWIDMALSLPVAHTYRERIALRRRGFIQTTLYMDDVQAIGSTNVAELRGTSSQVRLINAHRLATNGSDVGVFRILSNTEEYVALKTVQSETSILGILWVGNSPRDIDEPQRIELVMQWVGTDNYLPERNTHTDLGDIKQATSTVVNWMNYPARVLLVAFGERFTTQWDDSDQLTEALHISLPLPVRLNERDTDDEAVIPLIFALDFDLNDRNLLDTDAITTITVNEQLEISWQSPSGLLSMRVPRYALQTVFEWERLQGIIDGVEIHPVPLGSTLQATD
jgi:hypothetical protein